jgi:hypothetical protein
MRWINASQLQTWAGRIDARTVLSRLIGQLIRGSAAEISAFRFPAGDSAQLQGWDGRLIASPHDQFKTYVPDGSSVWEWGVEKSPAGKAKKDYAKRTANPGEDIVPSETTFVFVTPRTWEGAGTWAASNKKNGPWKDVRAFDAVDLEEWLGLCPAVAASFARGNGFAPSDHAQSIDEFWHIYSGRFSPPLREKVLLAGRSEQKKELEQALASGSGIQRCKGDSLDEVLAFVSAVIRSAEDGTREFLGARTLIVETEEAARQLRSSDGLIMAVRGGATGAAGMLANEGHRVIVPIGRDTIKPSSAITLPRPSAYEMSEGLQEMGFSEDEALRRAYECGRSVSILARRIPSATAGRPAWSNDQRLIPAFLAGAWDQSKAADKSIIVALAGANSYEDVEAGLRELLSLADAPLELVGSVWAVRAPVDLFVHISHLLQQERLTTLGQAVAEVLSELDPALELPPRERMYASLNGKVLKHSEWLRDGLATTLLILSAMGRENDVQTPAPSPELFVSRLVEALPGLRDDYRVIASLSRQLPMLMEAAPDPLLSALEQMLEGDGAKLKPVFQDSRESSSFWSSSPHTGLLWALERIGHDPKYLQRTTDILAGLVAIDPGGSLSNRPLASLHSLFLTWKPSTNASLEMRLAVLETLASAQPDISWQLIVGLLPRRGQVQFDSQSPRFRDAGASEREKLTYPVLFKTISAILTMAIRLAGLDDKRWSALLKEVHELPTSDRDRLISAFGHAVDQMSAEQLPTLWKELARLTRHHRAYPSAKWVMEDRQIAVLEGIAARIAPEEQGIQDKHLFTERFPDVPRLDPAKILEQVEELRKNAVERIVTSSGIEGVVDFASRVEAPSIVGGVFGTMVKSPSEAMSAILMNEALPERPVRFSSGVSSAAFIRFGDSWLSQIRHEIDTEKIQVELLQSLSEWWPIVPTVWNWISQFGEDAEKRFWQGKQPWGLKSKGEELSYVVSKYLRFERPEFVIEALSDRSSEISSLQLIAALVAFEQQIAVRPELLRFQGISFGLQQVFQSLQVREDLPLENVAALEYRYLPLLRHMWMDVNPESALDRYLGQSPAFFVQVVADVFRPASKRNDPKTSPTSEEQARAQVGITLLESFSRVPGQSGNDIDGSVLNRWVQDAQVIAKELDRAEVAEQYIGKLLTHAVADAEDNLWPHRMIREGLEKWKAPQIEKGIYIGLMNSRGVTSRGPFDGGKQERELAKQIRDNARRLDRWPRTKAVLIAQAESLEREAQREDTEAEQLRLRE